MTSSKAARPKRTDPAHPGFRIFNSPFYWLVRVAHRYGHEMDAVLKHIGMDLPRWRVLMILTEFEPCSVSYLAEHGAMKLSTMTKTVQRLAADHLVTTASRKTDTRVTEVRLTKPGRDAVSSVRIQASRIYQKSFDGMDGFAVEKLNGALQHVFDNLTNSPRKQKHATK